MSQRIFLPLFCSLVFIGCDLWDHSSDDPGDDDPEASVLLPLDVGNEWVMAFTRTDAEGEITATYTDTLLAVGDTIIAGERWTEIRCTQSTICFPAGYYTNREDGVWKLFGPDFEEDQSLVYKYPAEIGDAYLLPGSPGITVTVLGTETPVETPAGTLLAYHYQFDVDEFNGIPVPDAVGRFDRFFAPGQGFASFSCSYITLRGDEWETVSEFNWELIAFEGD